MVSLGVTLAVEAPVVLVIVKLIFKEKKVGWLKVLGFAALASCLTLPYLWFILPSYVDARLYICTGEALVFVVEAFIFFFGLGIRFHKALLVSLIANAASYFLGVLIHHI